MTQPLHILFTIDGESVAVRAYSEAPRKWEQSARALDGYCGRLLDAGFPPTMFLAYQVAAEHTPLIEELIGRGAEAGLLLNPPQVGDGRLTRCFGEYGEADQRALVDYAAERFADVLGARPRSFRPSRHSASDATFRVLADLGFRQGSVSRPGSRLARYAARWDQAPHDAHYADGASRLAPGSLPFLEVPVTTDPAQQLSNGEPFELRVELGTLEALHQPVIERALERMAEQQAPFWALCFVTDNRPSYDRRDDRHSQTLDEILDYLDLLAARFTLVPVTLAAAHERYRLVST